MSDLDLKLKFAMHDRLHCLTPGLFRNLQRGERKKNKLNVMYEFPNGEKVEFSGPEPLGDDDLRVLQGLIAMAGLGGKVLEETPKTPAGLTVRQLMEMKWGAVSKDGMVVKGSYRNLAREIGYTDVENTRALQESVERMWKVSVIVEKDGKRMGFRLLSEYGSDDKEGSLYVALNPQITSAIVGRVQFTHIDMAEVRAIKLGGTRLVHQRLCGWIDPGKTHKVTLDTICSYIVPEPCSNAAAMRKRRSRAKTVIAELVELGWKVVEYADGKYEITRPKASRAKKE